MDKLIITTPEELKQLITDSVQDVLDKRNIAAENVADVHGGAKYLTIAEAAGYLKLAQQTLYGFTSGRTIPFIKRAKRLLFTKSDLDEWLAQGKKQSLTQIRNGINGSHQKRDE